MLKTISKSCFEKTIKLYFFYFRRRLVCRYDNVTSVINAAELGPINRGCPYLPRRRKSDKQEPNGMQII
jgi:hypothetical protein